MMTLCCLMLYGLSVYVLLVHTMNSTISLELEGPGVGRRALSVEFACSPCVCRAFFLTLNCL